MQNEHVAKLNEIFSQANRVTRRDKALILGFMGGCRENPMPSPENYIVIKLGETEVNKSNGFPIFDRDFNRIVSHSLSLCALGTSETRGWNLCTDVS